MIIVLLASGEKGNRLSLPNSTIMLHSVGTQLGGQFPDIEKEMQETIRKQKVISEILSKHLSKDIEIIMKISKGIFIKLQKRLCRMV